VTLYRRLAILVGAVLVIFGAVLQLPAWSDTTATGDSSTSSAPAFTKSQTITRDDLTADGSDDVVDSRQFSVSVDRDTDLRGNQQLVVNWSGAHPTGGIVGDESSGTAAQYEEYPVVLIECRGVDSASAPTSEQVSPSTCWTQTTSERYNSDSNSAYPAWRLDRYASQAETTAHPGQPSPLNTACTSGGVPLADRWIPFVAADGTVYQPGYFPFKNCPSPLAPEATNVENSSAPGNTTYAVTDVNGNGTSKFVVWSEDQNGSLGCSQTVACSLEIIPIMGVSCATPLSSGESAADDAACRSAGDYQPGELFNPAISDLSVTGDLWWAASNWRNRVSVSLAFAESSNVCSVVSNSNPVLLYGSPAFAEASEQWEPYFCTNPNLFTFRHVQTGEPSVKNLLGLGLTSSTSGGTADSSQVASGSASTSASPSPAAASPVSSDGSAPPGNAASNGIEAVLESDSPPNGYLQPTIQAPIALTGFAISYIIDDPSGHEYTDLKLSPRLLAKLMTESYPDIPEVYNSYPALSKNPWDITHDPEFLALNPTLAPDAVGQDAAATLYSLSSNADTMYALTSYINADPEARAWLNGQPDPWGMVVNPNYKGISLPVESWPLLDSFEASFGGGGNNDCIDGNPVPYLPLVASPTSALSAIAQALQFAAPLSQTTCVLGGGSTSAGDKLTTGPRQQIGLRFMLGLTSLGDAEYYGLDTAALQTYQTSPDPTSKFTSDVGRLFASPTDASLIAAAKLASPDESTNTWPIAYGAMRDDPGNADAYPGTMFVYLAVPAAGLPAQDAADFAELMRFAVTQGQTPGFGNGQLPPGFAPMTSSDGLGDQIKYTRRAAAAVAEQRGQVPPLVNDVEASFSAPPPVSSAPSSPTAAAPSVAAPVAESTVGTQQEVNPGAPAVAGTMAPSSAGSSAAPLSNAAMPEPASSAASNPAAVFTGKTVASSSTLAGSALPSVLAIGLGGLLLASGLRFRVRRKL
jgi:hypothetical protein